MSKRYTAQEMRNAAQHLVDNLWAKDSTIVAMLRQAADAEEELRTMRSTWLTPETSKELLADCVSKTKEIDELKARLEAVVKIAEEQFDIIFHSPMCWDEDENESHNLEQMKEMDALEMVVAAARGEGGAE